MTDAQALETILKEKDPMTVLEASVLGMLLIMVKIGDKRVAVHEIGDEVRVRAVETEPAWRHVEWHGPKSLWLAAQGSVDEMKADGSGS